MNAFRASLAIALVLTANLAAPGAAADDAPPLLALAETVPATGEWPIVLADIEAARVALSALTENMDDTLLQVGPLAQVSILPVPEMPSIGMWGPDMPATIGFGLEDIDRIAAWGAPQQETAVIVTARALTGVDSALEARGFQQEERAGTPVWFRGEDLAINPQWRNDGPFTGMLGGSTRFAVQDRTLLFSRIWPGMQILLADGPPRLADFPDIRSILEAAYTNEAAGPPVQAVFMGGQPRLRTAAQTVDPLPAYGMHAVLQWQNGIDVTGGLALSFSSAEDAAAATEAIAGRLDLSTAFGTPFRTVLGETLDITTVETGDRSIVLLLASVPVRQTETEPHLVLFGRNPFYTLLAMWRNRDLELLIGAP